MTPLPGQPRGHGVAFEGEKSFLSFKNFLGGGGGNREQGGSNVSLMDERVVAGTAAVTRFAGCSAGALVWDERVAREIRSEHRIVGALAGIPQAPKRPHPRNQHRQRDEKLRKERLSSDSQSNELRQEEEGDKDPDCASDEADDAGYSRGLPLALSPEETQLLIPLLGEPWLRGSSTREGVSMKGESRGELGTSQLRRGDQGAEASTGATRPLSPAPLADHPQGEGVLEAPGSGVLGGDTHSTESGDLSQKEDGEQEWGIQEQGTEACPHGRVFEDLHRQGFTMTCGAKFGADFLAYRGDPREVHSLLMVKAVGESQAVPALHLLTLARLALAARKHLVLAATKDPVLGATKELVLAGAKNPALAATKGPAPAPASPATQGLSDASSRLQSESPPIDRASDLQDRERSCQEGSCTSALEACQVSPKAQQGPPSEPGSVLAPQQTGLPDSQTGQPDSQTGPPDSPQAPSFAVPKLPDYYTVTVDLGFIPRESKTEGHKMRAL